MYNSTVANFSTTIRPPRPPIQTSSPFSQTRSGGELDKEAWVSFVDYMGVIINSFGLITNLMVLLTIIRNNVLQRKASLLIGHQAFVDFFVCFIGSLSWIQYDSATFETSFPIITGILCYLWTNQLIFWFLMLISIQALVLLAMDRLIAVSRPINYRVMGIKSYIIAHVVIYIISLIINSLVLLDTVYFDGSSCDGQRSAYGKTIGIFGSTSYKTVGVIWLCFIYIFPSSLLGILYSMTLKSYRSVSFSTNSAISRSRRLLTLQLLRSSLVVTGLYIAACTVFAVYFLMNLASGGIEVRNNSDPMYRIGNLLLNLHSINPFIYCLMMRAFRHQMLLTITCGFVNPRKEVHPEENGRKRSGGTSKSNSVVSSTN